MVVEHSPGHDVAENDATAPGWRRSRPSLIGYRNDAVIALVLFAATLLSAWLYATISMGGEVAEPWVVVIWAAAITLPLAARRRLPEVIAISTSIAFVLLVPLQVPELLFSNITLFISFYSVGAWGSHRRRATILRVIIVVGMFLWLFGDLYFRSLDPESMPQLSRIGAVSPYAAFGLIQIIINLLYFGAAWFFGNSAFAAARQREILIRRTRELADERELSAAQAVSLERVRIARELHDVVAHHVSVMGVQAGAARPILKRDPEGAAVALSAIETSARGAIDDLHRMLVTLRDDRAGTADDPASASSTRGIAQLPELVAASSASGVPTRLVTVGTVRAVPPTVDLSVYRVAQESLTNSRKHGGAGTTAEVRLRFQASAVELEVADTGSGRSATSTHHPGGLGHIGMRERVAATGGAIEIGPRPSVGFVVRASFPSPVVALEAAILETVTFEATMVETATLETAAFEATIPETAIPGGGTQNAPARRIP